MQHKFVNFHHTVKPVAHILIFLGFLCNIVLAFATCTPAQSNCEEFKFLKNCKKDTDEFQLCHANAWINATFTIFHGQIPEYDKFSKICEFDICTDENPLVSCANQDAYKRIIPYITTNMESSKPPIAPVNCSQFHFLGKCNSDELSVCSANSLINTTFTEIKQTVSEFDTFSKICSCNNDTGNKLSFTQ
ncbi:uncharacterized protein LOC111102288 isoform X4 [Crassostrea virginica]